MRVVMQVGELKPSMKLTEITLAATEVAFLPWRFPPLAFSSPGALLLHGLPWQPPLAASPDGLSFGFPASAVTCCHVSLAFGMYA